MKKILIILMLLLVVTGCGKTDDKKAEDKKETPIVEKPKLKIVDEDSKSRPYAIMINNIGVARPVQTGLQDAYIIYELIVEGGITRYLALFMDQNTAQIGTVRSARHYYLDYALENDAIYIHHGKSPQAQEDISKLKVDRIEINDTTSGWRDKSNGLSTEHTLYTNIERLSKASSKFRQERNKDLLLNYSIDSVDLANIPNSKEAKNITIKYSNAVKDSYVYDEEAKVYKRSVNGKPHTDYLTKEQYTFKNIIAYDVKNSQIPNDSKNRQELSNIGSGKGYYISEGYAIPITWSKTSRSSQTEYKLESGEELKVNDGNTFIQIYPKSGSITIN